MLTKLLATMLGVALITSNPVVAQELKEINFGILSTESSQNLKQDWQPVIDDMSSRLGVKVKDFFLAYAKNGADVAREKAQLNKLTLGGFQDSSNAQLKPVRQLELFKQKLKLEADATMQADEKRTKLDDIGRQLSDVAKS